MADVELIKQFEVDLAKNVVEMQKIAKFPRLQRMFDEHGYFEGAKRLINTKQTEGFTKLFLAGKPEILIEYLALTDKFSSLFTEDELNKCRKKLGFL